jgi:hypothetical protein
MATNTGQSSRNGAVKVRSQVFNPSTGNFVKRDSATGRFLDVKSDGKPFKGVKREETFVKANPSVNKLVAQRAENAVIKIRNSKREL